MDVHRNNNSFFLIDLDRRQILVATKTSFSAESGYDFVKKAGQTGQTMAYGVMALVGVRKKNYSAYLFGQEEGINHLIGGTIPKRFHKGGSSGNATSKGCIIVSDRQYEKTSRETGDFGEQNNEAVMLYAHTTKAIDTKTGKNAFSEYAKKSRMLDLSFIDRLLLNDDGFL